MNKPLSPFQYLALAALLGVPATATIAQAAIAPSVSAYQSIPDDPRAVTVRAKGDGVADDTAAIQQAIDSAANKGEGGLVFLPSGRYRISRSLLIPIAVRLYGVGKTRPVLVLGANTPGFQKGVGHMVIFTGTDTYNVGAVAMPVPGAVPFSTEPGKAVRDANSSTFYSALSNIDFEVGAGNPAATGVRMHTAQHSNLSHIDFRMGPGLAGVYQVGNIAYNLRFFGGRYGILAEKTSPAWQFTLLDSHFDGQRDAAIREHEAALTLANTEIRNTPVGIEIDRGYGDWLWGADVRFTNVSKAALVVSNESNVYTQVGFERVSADNVPVFAQFRDSGKQLAGQGRRYVVSEFNHGLKLSGLGQPGQFDTNFQTSSAPARQVEPVMRSLPATGEWVSVRRYGAKGDGVSDDTAAIQQAIDKHRVVYLPLGFYAVNDTIRLKSDTVLIGLHPGLARLVLPNGSPRYQGSGAPKALLESARGGDAIVTGIGLATGEVNNRAVGLLWRAGARSLVDDIRMQWGYGSSTDPYKKSPRFVTSSWWDRQYPNIWVTDGGGGTFTGVWAPAGHSQAGFYVTNTKTRGRVYELSAEHHIRNEIVLDGVENWEFHAPQTEEEVHDGADSVALDIRNSKNILLANFHAYRVTRSIKPAPTAVKISNSSDIRFRNVAVNSESGFPTCDENGCTTFLRASKYGYENAITEMDSRLQVRERMFSVFDYTGKGAVPAAMSSPKVELLEQGFHSIAGGAVDSKGRLYFIDRHFQHIFSYAKGEGVRTVSDYPLEPVNLAVDASDKLLVLSSSGKDASVYALEPGVAGAVPTFIEPTAAQTRTKARVALPVNWWVNGEFRDQLDVQTYEFATLDELFAQDAATPKSRQYVSPDGSLVLPAFRVTRHGSLDHLGHRWSHTLNSNGFVTAPVGQRAVLTSSSRNITYSALVGPGGTLTDLKQVADRGGESAALGPDSKVYVANGQVFIYGADGKPAGRIDVPARPLQLVFGGPNGRTLFILTHHALYAMVI